MLSKISRSTQNLCLTPRGLTAFSKSFSYSHFQHVEEAPADEVFGLAARYKADPHPQKVDLGIGAYRTDTGSPLVLNVVKKAEKVVLQDTLEGKLNHEYLAIDGDQKFITSARSLLFGKDSDLIKEGRIATIQTLSGTGSLRVGFEFIARYLPKGTQMLVPNPTWGNHYGLAKFSGEGIPVQKYRYWDAKNRKLALSEMLEDIRDAPNRSIVLLHACAHNPTGVDPTQEEWKQICEVIKQKQHIPYFDSAYQGFATGSLDGDAWSIRYFASQGLQLFASQSFAKNFGLYNERAGTLSIVCANKDEASRVLSQLKVLVRPMYSNPPAHGARVVSTVLGSPELYSEWVQELQGMSGRIISMRKALKDELIKLKTPGNWDHITNQIGMFSFLGLTPAQCKVLVEKHHIYLLNSARISMAGINNKNVAQVAAAIDDVVRNVH